MTYCSYEIESVKLWKKLFFHLFDLGRENTHTLHQKASKQNFKVNQFVKRWQKVYRVTQEKKSQNNDQQILHADYWAEDVLSVGFLQQNQQKKAQLSIHVRCVSHQKGSQETYYCVLSKVLPLGYCFQILHTHTIWSNILKWTIMQNLDLLVKW
jgi:hypothetical protein